MLGFSPLIPDLLRTGLPSKEPKEAPLFVCFDPCERVVLSVSSKASFIQMAEAVRPGAPKRPPYVRLPSSTKTLHTKETFSELFLLSGYNYNYINYCREKSVFAFASVSHWTNYQ